MTTNAECSDHFKQCHLCSSLRCQLRPCALMGLPEMWGKPSYLTSARFDLCEVLSNTFGVCDCVCKTKVLLHILVWPTPSFLTFQLSTPQPDPMGNDVQKVFREVDRIGSQLGVSVSAHMELVTGPPRDFELCEGRF